MWYFVNILEEEIKANSEVNGVDNLRSREFLMTSVYSVKIGISVES